MWVAWFFPLTAVGTFLTLLAYLLVLPARSRGLWITQIVLTSLAAIFALITVLLILQWLPNLALVVLDRVVRAGLGAFVLRDALRP